MELQLVVHGLAGEEALEFGDAHLLDVLEGHVISHEGLGGLDLGIGEPEAAHDAARDLGAHVFMAVEADASGFIDLIGGGLAEVVEENAQDQRHGDVGGQQVEHDAGVDEDVALGMELRGLLAALERLDLGQQLAQESARIEQVEAAHPAGVGEDLHQLVADALGAHDMDLRGEVADGRPCIRLDLEAEPGGEADAAQDAQLVLLEALARIPDGADDARLEIGAAADVVDHAFLDGIVEKAVDREIAPPGIALGIGKGDGFRVASVAVLAIGAEGGDFVFTAILEHDNDAELRPDRHGAREQALDLFRPGAGGDVIVLGLRAEQQIAHAAASKAGLVSMCAKGFDKAAGRSFHIRRQHVAPARSRQDPRNFGF